MQSLIQDIFSQIIDSSAYFPEKFCDLSCMRFPFKTKQKMLYHVNSFWSEIYKKCQSQGDSSPLDALFQMASKTFEGLKAKSGKTFFRDFFFVLK